MDKSDLVEGVVVRINGFDKAIDTPVYGDGLYVVCEDKLLQLETYGYCYLSDFDDDLEIKDIGVKITNIYSNLNLKKIWEDKYNGK